VGGGSFRWREKSEPSEVAGGQDDDAQPSRAGSEFDVDIGCDSAGWCDFVATDRDLAGGAGMQQRVRPAAAELFCSDLRAALGRQSGVDLRGVAIK